MSKEKVAFYSVLVVFLLSLVSALYFLWIRIFSLIQGNANPGRVISTFILLFYAYYLIKSIYLFSKLKREAIEKGVTAMYLGIILSLWLYLLAPILLAEDFTTKIEILKSSFFFLLLNLGIGIILLVYLKRSKEIRKILIAK